MNVSKTAGNFEKEKIVKKNIKIFLILCVIAVLCGCGYLFAHYQHTSPKRLPDRYGAEIPKVHSSVDKDNDGIDDQTDILQGALDYVASRPKYKSKYYRTGYPNDGYGVCTDVVAFALKNAGYDLMTLVQQDIEANPADYDIEEADQNIDFRRVKNLRVYFSHSAISLTTDISEIEEWQGGDIVIFKNHIGIVSDRRNENGVPYVIHHNDPWQRTYEEDILEDREDIVGHYRVAE
ncbi:MAG: DUF1287 domain-containing protein [Oscillospiraceae bacterium]